uniref:CRISPR-associated endonuclease Cas1 n=1 Tax=Conchiformibius kuhniae TaxID=211502 RepID=A0A8T9MTK5_9NEIS|nr:CRISPR-associated endonuclease Cas1 [Conchiformibius kuhniae]
MLGKLGEHGIGVLVLSGKQQQAALMMPNTKLDARRRTLQHTQAQDPEAALRIAKNLIAEKTERQAQLLRRIGQTALQHAHRLHRPAEQIQALVQAVAAAPDSDSLRGLEGAAAPAIFKHGKASCPPHSTFRYATAARPATRSTASYHWATPCCILKSSATFTCADSTPASAFTTTCNTDANRSPATCSNPCAPNTTNGR